MYFAGIWCVLKVPAGERKEPAILIIIGSAAFLITLLLENREHHFENKSIGIYTVFAIISSIFAAVFIRNWRVMSLYITEGIVCIGVITHFKFLRKK